MYAKTTVVAFQLVLIFCFSHSSPLPVLDSHSSICSHQFTADLSMQSSAWKVLLESGRFSPVKDNTNHHMKRLRHKLAELVAIIDFHKEKYAQDVFGDSFTQLDKELGDLHYKEIVPLDSQMYISENSNVDDQIDQVSSESHFLEAYSIFQRLSLSMEVVVTDLQHHQHSTNRMWRASTRTVSNILRSIYTELVMKGIDIPAALTRDVIPQGMRCLPFSAYRDTRDFIILRHLMQAAQFYSQLLHLA
eukprot:GFUD01029970.1.p1 GENE.GFUD01029970.1~~GFUD01029970.1.p1  ORF type:complete len:247 (-),score=53.11 GFUD01029970.1:298-1038(-)